VVVLEFVLLYVGKNPASPGRDWDVSLGIAVRLIVKYLTMIGASLKSSFTFPYLCHFGLIEPGYPNLPVKTEDELIDPGTLQLNQPKKKGVHSVSEVLKVELPQSLILKTRNRVTLAHTC
jgi:hypothetical protein